MPDWAGGAYIAEEVAPWIDSSGNLVAASGGAAVGTPPPGTPDTPVGPSGGGHAKLHPVQPVHHGVHAQKQTAGWHEHYIAAMPFDLRGASKGNEQLLRLSHARPVPLEEGRRKLAVSPGEGFANIPEAWDAIRDALDKGFGHSKDPKWPGDDEFAKKFIRKHWGGPAFTIADVVDADRLVSGHVAFRGSPSEVELGKNVARNLLQHGYALEGQMFDARRERLRRLESQLSATAFVLYVVTEGGAGGYLPSRGSPWLPRP